MKRTVSSVMTDRITARTTTRSEWKAWKRYSTLLMREGRSEKTRAAEKRLEIIIAAAMIRQSFHGPMSKLRDAFSAVSPAVKNLLAAMENHQV